MRFAERLSEVTAVFLKLGLTSFGGPIAHVGYLHAELVDKRRWIEGSDFADLLALCQFLPGPASSQLVFALGMRRAGLAGALAASMCFTLPSAALMIAFAYGLAGISDLGKAGWLHGLKLAAVAVVTQAVWTMGKKLCPDRPRLTICLATAALLSVVNGALAQLAVLAAGAIAGWRLYRTSTSPAELPAATSRPRRAAASALILFVVLLLALPLASARNWSSVNQPRGTSSARNNGSTT